MVKVTITINEVMMKYIKPVLYWRLLEDMAKVMEKNVGFKTKNPVQIATLLYTYL